ncbi:hypothetical protein BKA70DRAFT_1238471 [Coprinopsis sp. MPI-PUGE-AT-0042]|nr:hypothetical protein BKA70DRAFT_1238471 [Coprinopsis sp. MPI-PUGE-AT-0042]
MPRYTVSSDSFERRSSNHVSHPVTTIDRRGGIIRPLTRSATRALQLSAPPLPRRRVGGATGTSRVPGLAGARGGDSDYVHKMEPPVVTTASELVQNPTETQSSVQSDEFRALAEELKHAKRSLQTKMANLRTAREELAMAKEELSEKQGEIEQLTEHLDGANVSKEQYRNWWINEVQFTKIILSKVPNANQDWDLVRSSQTHYLGRY